MTYSDPTPTGPAGIPRSEREKIMAEMLEHVRTTGEFYADEFSDEQRGDMQRIFQESMNSWLDAKYDAAAAQFGKWAIRTMLVLVIGAMLVFVLNMNGWHLSSAASAAESAK